MMGASVLEKLGHAPIAAALKPTCGLERVQRNTRGQNVVPYAKDWATSASVCQAKPFLADFSNQSAYRRVGRCGGFRQSDSYSCRQGGIAIAGLHSNFPQQSQLYPQKCCNGFLGQALLHQRYKKKRHLPRSASARAAFDIMKESHTAIEHVTSTFQLGAHLPAVTLAASVLGGLLGSEGLGGWEVAIATATGVTAGAAASWAIAQSQNDSQETILEGKLIAPTESKFNQSVLERSPLLKDISSGKSLKSSAVAKKGQEDTFKYRRHCIQLSDGGHLAFDWPAHLALLGEDSRDSVVLIIPGTAAGSSDGGVKMLVKKAEQLGHFPVVVNQRGFAGSPVTTPKLFDAGCTEDLAQAVAFVRGQRPNATISAVATGMGASLLVKYLGERPAEAPLIDAAVAVGCPFDLAASTDNLTRPSNHDRSALLAAERVELLRAHLPLFEGKSSSVEPALTAASVAELDELFTGRVNGYSSVEGYYGAASCGCHIEGVKTPLFFIQSDDDALAPAAAIPRAAIHKNPCTSLLLTRGSRDISMTSIEDQVADVALEWLAAVELALLRGKDPLGLEPSERIENGAFAESEESEAASKSDGHTASESRSSENGWSSPAAAFDGQSAQGSAADGMDGVSETSGQADASGERSKTAEQDGEVESEEERVEAISGRSGQEGETAAPGGERVDEARASQSVLGSSKGEEGPAVAETEGPGEQTTGKQSEQKATRTSSERDDENADAQTEPAEAQSHKVSEGGAGLSEKGAEGLTGEEGKVSEVPKKPQSAGAQAEGLEAPKAKREGAGAAPKKAADARTDCSDNGTASSQRPTLAESEEAGESEKAAPTSGSKVGHGGSRPKLERSEGAKESVAGAEEKAKRNARADLATVRDSGKKSGKGRQVESGQHSGKRRQQEGLDSPSHDRQLEKATKKSGATTTSSADGQHERPPKGSVGHKEGDKHAVVSSKDKTDSKQTKSTAEKGTGKEGGAKKEEKSNDKTDSQEGEPPKEGEEAPPPADPKGIATATAESFLHVADVALPGTLSEEKKQQVVAAVNKGESLTTALDLAVPPDVRMKVTGAVQTYMETTKGKAGELTKQIDMDRVSGLFADQGGRLVSKITGGLKGTLGGPPPKPADPPKAAEPAGKPAPKAEAGKVANPPPAESTPPSSSPPKAEPQKGGEQAAPKTDPPKAEATPDKPKSESPPPQENRAPPAESTKANAAPPEAPRSDSKDKPPPPNNTEAPKADLPASNPTETKSATAPPQSDDAPAASRGNAERPDSTPPPKNEAPKKEDTPPPQKAADATGENASGPAQSAESAQAGDNQNQSGGDAQPSGEAAPPPPPAEAPKDDAPPPPKSDEPPPPTHVESASQAAAVAAPVVDSVQAAAAPPNAPPPPAAPLPPPPQLSNVGSALTTLDQGFDDGTQRAVHNVFGVLEGVIDTLEAAEAAKEPEKPAEQKSNGNRNGKATEAASSGVLEKEIAKEVGENGRAEVTGTTEQGTKQTLVAEQTRTELDGGRTSVENEVRAEASRDVGGGTDSQEGSVGMSVSRTTADNGHSKERGKEKVTMSVEGGDGSVVTTERVREQEAGASSNRAVITEHRNGTNSNGALKSNNGVALENRASTNGVGNGKAKADDEIEANRQRLQRQYDNPPVKANEDGNNGQSSGGGVLQAVKSSPPVAVVTQAVGTVGSAAAAVANGLPEHRKLELADVILTSLKLEIGRRVGTSGFNALTSVNWEEEAGKVAQAVSECLTGGGALEGLAEPPGPREVSGTESPGAQPSAPKGVDVGAIMKAIGSVVGTGGMFGGLLPMGVLVGVVVAAVGTLYHVMQDSKKEKAKEKAEAEEAETESVPIETEDDIALGLGTKWDEEPEGESGVAEMEPDQVEHVNPHKGLSSEQTASIIGAGGVVVAAAATVAASATGVTAQDIPQAITPPPEQQNAPQGGGGLSNTVGHLATQAVAVVKSQIPRDASGDVDQERLVLLLADAGGRGGMFRIAGKLALFWGGIRGATRVTERLLGFLKMDQRNLPKRMLGFGAMALILWTPVLVPLLPTILGHRATGGRGGIAEAAAAAGLYLAVLMLIHIWGHVVRGFKRPFTAYGLRMFNRRSAGQMFTGQMAGIFLVAAYYALQLRLGHVTWLGGATQKPAANVAAGIVRSFSKVHLVIHAFAVGVAVSVVEELIFRSWIHEEAAADLGPHGAALLSAALFSIAHWSKTAAPGLFLLGIALIGARARARGNLALPMGLHSGLIAANYVVQVGQLMTVNTRAPVWLTGGGNPLVSVLGMGMTAVMAAGLYPWGRGFMIQRDPQDAVAQTEVSEEEAQRQIKEHGKREESDLKARIDDLGGKEPEQVQVQGGGTEAKE